MEVDLVVRVFCNILKKFLFSFHCVGCLRKLILYLGTDTLAKQMKLCVVSVFINGG